MAHVARDDGGQVQQRHNAGNDKFGLMELKFFDEQRRSRPPNSVGRGR